jgi:hypothetical protein
VTNTRHALFVLASCVTLGGCFRATVYSGEPPARPPAGYDEHWHHGFVAGLIESEGSYELDQACPNGWAEVGTTTDPLDSLLTVLTWTLYSPQDVSIVCAERTAPVATRTGGSSQGPRTASSAHPHDFPPSPPEPDPL